MPLSQRNGNATLRSTTDSLSRFSSVGERSKAIIGALPFAGTLIDIGGMWGTRFISPSLSVLVIAGGTLFALGYALIAALSTYDLWFRKELSP